MTEFIKYPHLERFGTDEVDGINLGDVHVFPKIDGTNASIWFDEDSNPVACGSRSRVLSLDDDNAGFMNWATRSSPHNELVVAHPRLVFYGEWLVPHSLKTYRDDAWRRFYIFDVLNRDTGEFLHFDEYQRIVSEFGVDYIPCIGTGRNITYEQLVGFRDRNTFLVQDDKGVGEGIVIKQYGWKNRLDRTTWAKLITTTFKDEHIKEMGGAVISSKMVEDEIAEEFITRHTVDKIVAKIRNEQGAFGARNIPQLLGTAFHELVTEELWEAIKKHKNPKIDFKTLNHFAIARVKCLMPELFGLKVASC